MLVIEASLSACSVAFMVVQQSLDLIGKGGLER